MKDELSVKESRWKTIEEAGKDIKDWMDYYNKDRYQWELSKLSPDEFYEYITTKVYPISGV